MPAHCATCHPPTPTVHPRLLLLRRYVLSKLPAGGLPEIRALMHERLGLHVEALHMYVHVIRDLPLAEAYCERVCRAAAAAAASEAAQGGQLQQAHVHGAAVGLLDPLHQAANDIYMQLIRVILQGPAEAVGPGGSSSGAAGPPSRSPSPSTWQQLAWLLGRKPDVIEPLALLELLPEEAPLGEVLLLVQGLVRRAVEARHSSALARSLWKSEALATRQALAAAKARSVLLSAERACSLCHKRIGSAVFVAYPNLTLAHYLCHTRATPAAKRPSPAVGAQG